MSFLPPRKLLSHARKDRGWSGRGTEIWIDPQGYKDYVANEEKAYLAEIEKEK